MQKLDRKGWLALYIMTTPSSEDQPREEDEARKVMKIYRRASKQLNDRDWQWLMHKIYNYNTGDMISMKDRVTGHWERPRPRALEISWEWKARPGGITNAPDF